MLLYCVIRPAATRRSDTGDVCHQQWSHRRLVISATDCAEACLYAGMNRYRNYQISRCNIWINEKTILTLLC